MKRLSDLLLQLFRGEVALFVGIYLAGSIGLAWLAGLANEGRLSDFGWLGLLSYSVRLLLLQFQHCSCSIQGWPARN